MDDISDALLDDALQPGFLPDVSRLVSRLTVAGDSGSSSFPSELSKLQLLARSMPIRSRQDFGAQSVQSGCSPHCIVPPRRGLSLPPPK
jgi:hypothetical protein